MSQRELLLIGIGQWLTAAFLVMIGYSLWATFAPAKPPVTPITGEYSALKTPDGTIVVSYRCNSIFHEDFEMHTHREIKHEPSGLIVVLPTTEVAYTKGQRISYRQFYIPPPAPMGKWCVTSKSEWRPTFSLRDRTTTPVTKCFEVEK